LHGEGGVWKFVHAFLAFVFPAKAGIHPLPSDPKKKPKIANKNLQKSTFVFIVQVIHPPVLMPY
jgi:hypothetical protein